MKLAFNELSFLPLNDNPHRLLNHFSQLLKTFAHARELFNFDHILFPAGMASTQVTAENNLAEWLTSLSTSDKNRIFSIIYRKPFLQDAIRLHESELTAYYYQNLEIGIDQEYCDGLATADLLEIPSISLINHPSWEMPKITIFKENQEVGSQISREVVNLSTSDSLKNADFQSFAESKRQIELIKSPLSHEEKIIHLRPDHGSDILLEFAKKIVRSEYVEGVVNSLPFNPQTSRFIRNITKDGLIEIVLHWEDAGYGMVLKTTGRNYRETETIAGILDSDYGK